MRTLVFDPLANLAAQCRAGGYPVRAIKRRDWTQQAGPDDTRTEVTRPLFGAPISVESSYYAPIFDWWLEDGQRFTGKVRLHLKRREYVGYLWSETRYEPDHWAQNADLITMIKESCAALREMATSATAPDQ